MCTEGKAAAYLTVDVELVPLRVYPVWELILKIKLSACFWC